jgi:predicted tellurium resistance membrane protein TerC
VTFRELLFQILLLDIVFSIDSIITAVGMVKELWIMYTAVIVSVVIMLLAAKSISDFISRHPSFKILALCFLLVIVISLMSEGLDFHIPKGYIYFSLAFSFFVDFIQLKKIKTK